MRILVLITLLVAAPSLAAPPRGGKAAGQVSSPNKTGAAPKAAAATNKWHVWLQRAFRAGPRTNPQQRPLTPYKLGDVYLDYASEDVRFRYQNQTGKVYRRFYGQPEVEVSHSSNLFREAMAAGKQITRDEYNGPARPLP